MGRNKYLIVFLLFIGGLWFACGVNDKTIVARVDNYVIHLDELKKALPKVKKNESSGTEYKAALDDLINKRLKVVEAYRSGIDHEDDIQKRISDTERRAVYQILIEEVLIKKYIPDSDIKDYYKHSNKEVWVRQALISLPENATEQEVSEARHRLTEARNRVLKGEGFITIVTEYSNDSTVIENKGDMGFLSWGSSLHDRELIKTAFGLGEGRISLPFRTSKGYQLIKVENTKPIEQKPYKEIKDKIKQTLFKQRRSELETAYYTMVDKIKAANDIKYVDDNIVHFAESVKNDSTLSDSLKPKTGDQFDSVSEEDMDRALVISAQGIFITIEKVIEDIRRYPPYRQPKLDNEKMVREWLDRMVPYELLISEGYKAKFQTRSEVKQKVTSQLESLMVSRIESRETTEKISPTEDDYKEYYEANKTKYKNPETVKVQEIYVKGNSLAMEIATRAKRGEDFNSLADEFNTGSTTKNNHGMLGYIRKDQYGSVGRTAFDMSIGEIAGPIKIGKNYSVIQVLDRKPEGQKDYEQAKSRIRSDVRRQMLTQRENEWIAELQANANVQIYEGVLKKAFPSGDI